MTTILISSFIIYTVNHYIFNIICIVMYYYFIVIRNILRPEQAEEDCTKALFIDPKMLKAKLQRSQAREMKGHLRGACLDLQDILILDPSNQVAKNALNRLRPIFEVIIFINVIFLP